jgi:CBS domain-containing protein
MGEQRVSLLSNDHSMQRFVRHLLDDVRALRYMLDNDWFEDDVVRLGAEQEMFLVHKKSYKPASLAMEALERMQDLDWVETELARFNLEINLQPRVFEGNSLRLLEEETNYKLSKIRERLDGLGAEIILTGILPTLRKYDLEMHNLTPKQRYFALMEAINKQLIGSAYELRLMGIDELLVKHNSPLLEACNTSFQVHLQVPPKAFVQTYNIAQALTGPILAIAANSPIVFGKRLWHESRIALFQQSLDTRTTHEHMRERSPRVSFGTGWLDHSVLDIHREDIARFRVLLGGDIEEASLEKIAAGEVPRLRALQVHNSTVYRWNRPCYGISENGKPHLRIENRVLPAGPTVVDEVANAALWLGAVTGYVDQYPDVRRHISWEDVRDNFSKGARIGMDSAFTWFDDRKIGAGELLLKEIIPMARHGLELRKIDTQDIDRYLGIVEERARFHMNGARWQLRSFTALRKEVGRDEALTCLTASIVKNQKQEIPVHKWSMPNIQDLDEYTPAKLLVDEFMETDLFTVQKDDIIELVAEMMDWRRIRYMPVEDAKGQLCGLVTSRLVLRHFYTRNKALMPETSMVRDVMITDPITISPGATIAEAMRIMREKRIGCLPVVKDGELVGIITEMDFLRVTGRLIERMDD